MTMKMVITQCKTVELQFTRQIKMVWWWSKVVVHAFEGKEKKKLLDTFESCKSFAFMLNWTALEIP